MYQYFTNKQLKERQRYLKKGYQFITLYIKEDGRKLKLTTTKEGSIKPLLLTATEWEIAKYQDLSPNKDFSDYEFLGLTQYNGKHN